MHPYGRLGSDIGMETIKKNNNCKAEKKNNLKNLNIAEEEEVRFFQPRGGRPTFSPRVLTVEESSGSHPAELPKGERVRSTGHVSQKKFKNPWRISGPVDWEFGREEKKNEGNESKNLLKHRKKNPKAPLFTLNFLF
ncbi:hypothetical protein RUM43_001169 [Polyplax serrata]|uniref:Uncharacterized protein n=1 Tax=Polyplax serrata TaxID=468196 RepID=A0AAN8SDE6_POLSC